MRGFISFIGVVTEDRLFTITAWEDAEAPSQLLKGGTHKQAMDHFFSTGAREFSSGGMTSVWVPNRINALWVRCKSCGQMVASDKAQGRCSCGAALPELAYW